MIRYDEEIIREAIDSMLETFRGDLEEHTNGDSSTLPYTKEETEHAINVLQDIKDNLDKNVYEYLAGRTPNGNLIYDSVKGEVKLIRLAMKNKIRNNDVFQFDSRYPNRIPSRRRLVSDLRKTLSIKTLWKAGNYKSQMIVPMLISKYDIRPEEWCKGINDGLWSKFTPTVSREEMIELLETSKGLSDVASKLKVTPDRIRIELMYYDIDVEKYKCNTNGKKRYTT